MGPLHGGRIEIDLAIASAYANAHANAHANAVYTNGTTTIAIASANATARANAVYANGTTADAIDAAHAYANAVYTNGTTTDAIASAHAADLANANAVYTLNTHTMNNKALVITNKGLIDPLAFNLIGASSKRNDSSTIGFFGSGVKYAIAGLLREGIDFQVWRGNDPVDFTTEEVTMRGQVFSRILIDGQPTSMTTDMGPKWERWMFIRELYANAIDEEGEMMLTEDYQDYIAPDRTTIILPSVHQIADILDKQDHYFARGRDIIYEDENIIIYDEIGDGGLYVKGILVTPDIKGKGGFGYQLKNKPFEISEDRILRHDFIAYRNLMQILFTVNERRVVNKLTSRLRTSGTLERHMMEGLYAFDTIPSAEAWHHITLFPPEAAEFATSDKHLAVADRVYERLIHPNKWKNRKWTPSGTDKENTKLSEAFALVERDGGGPAPSTPSFGRGVSDKQGMGFDDGTTYVTETLRGETVQRLAAHIAVMRSSADGPDYLLRCMEERYTGC